MSTENIFGIIIMTLCNLACAVSFFGIGIWAQKRKDPMHFYSGTAVDPRTISDIPAYNWENAKMWKQFSIPFFLAALFSVVGFWDRRFHTISIVLMVAGCTVGIGWLVNKYHRICKEYMVR